MVAWPSRSSICGSISYIESDLFSQLRYSYGPTPGYQSRGSYVDAFPMHYGYSRQLSSYQCICGSPDSKQRELILSSILRGCCVFLQDDVPLLPTNQCSSCNLHRLA